MEMKLCTVCVYRENVNIYCYFNHKCIGVKLQEGEIFLVLKVDFY